MTNTKSETLVTTPGAHYLLIQESQVATHIQPTNAILEKEYNICLTDEFINTKCREIIVGDHTDNPRILLAPQRGVDPVDKTNVEVAIRPSGTLLQ